jgi:hypothetical protein
MVYSLWNDRIVLDEEVVIDKEKRLSYREIINLMISKDSERRKKHVYSCTF